MKCRKNIAQLSPGERSALVQAFLDLKDPTKAPSRIPAAQNAVIAGGGTPNRYDDYVWIHNTVGFGAHWGPGFAPWHREFLRQMEFDLQQVSGDPDLTLPYWDWTTARTPASAGWPFTNDLMGGFGNAGPGPTTGFVTAGPFSDPAAWRINIRRGTDLDLTLKRSRGVPSGADLPDRDDILFALGVPITGTWPSVFDSPPWNDTGGQPTDGQILGSFRKFLERVLHDGIHVWIGDAWEFDFQNRPRDGGHMTFPAVAVNDPVFWLHHCNVDRIWSIWQRKAAQSGYLPQVPGTAAAGHNGEDPMTNLALAEWFNSPLNVHPNDVQGHQALGYWYHTDIPEVTLTTPALDFGTVPGSGQAARSVMFAVRTCQPVTFEITSVVGVNFRAHTVSPVVIDHDHANDVLTAELAVQFDANGQAGLTQAGAVTVVARIIDTDGYDSGAPGSPLVLGTWTVALSGTPAAVEPPTPVAPGEGTRGGTAREESLTMNQHPSGDEDGHAAMAQGDHDHDHENMAFTMFRRTGSGGLVELQAGDIERDTEDYDDKGHDRGREPEPTSPPDHDHDHTP